MIEGIDISDYNEVDSFHEVAADGISFIYCKATQGLGNIQTSFIQNMDRIESVPGLAFGAYHFFDWSQNPVYQAAHFLSVYKPKSGDLIPMLDIESIAVPPDVATQKIASFLSACEPLLGGRKMLLYMNWDTINSQLINTSDFSGHPLWLAMYGNSYSIPSTWTQPTIWQYTDSGNVIGVVGDVDRDKCYVTLDLLRMDL